MECIPRRWQCIGDWCYDGDAAAAASKSGTSGGDCDYFVATHGDGLNVLRRPHHEDRIALPHLNWKHYWFCLFSPADSALDSNDSCKPEKVH